MSKSRRKAKAPQNRRIRNPKTRIAFYVLLVGVGLVIFLPASGCTFAGSQEQHDIFCSSCHTQPESTFYQRSLGTQAVDLASAHKAKQVRCIDCHSGVGVAGRIQAELLGAHNALAYYSKTAVEPAKLTRPIADANCLKCHQDINGPVDMNNHFHVFLPRWQAVDPNAATCVSCHQGHSDNGNSQIMFLNEATTREVCQACHAAIRE